MMGPKRCTAWWSDRGAAASTAAAAADEMFVLASEELSTMTDMEELEQGR
jgi:hypothetical protein